MATLLLLECPHCKQAVQVQESLIDDNVDCPKCERAFRVEVPAARPLDPAGVRESARDVREIRSPANDEETLRVVHPVLFRRHLLLTTMCALVVCAGIAGAILYLLGREFFGVAGDLLIFGSLAGVVLAGLYLLYLWIVIVATKLTVTSKRTIYTRGIIARRTSEVLHDDVRNIQCNQNVMERLLNYGDVGLSSAGQSTLEIVIDDIPDPQGVIELIRQRQ